MSLGPLVQGHTSAIQLSARPGVSAGYWPEALIPCGVGLYRATPIVVAYFTHTEGSETDRNTEVLEMTTNLGNDVPSLWPYSVHLK